MNTRVKVQELIDEGFGRPHPIPKGEKGPRIVGWQDPNKTFAPQDFATDDNVGTLLVGDLVDIDLDCDEAVRAAGLLLRTPRVHGRRSRRRSHFWFRATGVTAQTFRDPKSRKPLVEIRTGTKQQTLLPPSLHPSSEPLSWDSDGAPAPVDGAGLTRAVRLVATAALVVRYWPSGERHNLLLALAGLLERAKVSRTECCELLEEITRQTEGLIWSECRRDVEDTYGKAADAKTTGAGKLEEILGKDVADCLREWFKQPKSELTYALKLNDEVERVRLKREATRIVDADERPIVELPAALTLRERLASPPSPLAWRIENWLPVGCRALLAAQFKAGKTTLIQNVIRSLVDGDPFLGDASVTPIDGRVVVLDFEMSERQLDVWLRDQRIKHDDRVVVLPLRGLASSFDLRLPQVLQRWVDRLRQLDARFLILDCLRPVLDAIGLDEHRDAGLLLTSFDTLLRESGVGEAIVVHHFGHNGERARGDSRLRDWPDSEWRLVREDDADPASARFVTAFGRDVDVPESQLAFDQETRRLVITGGSRRDVKTEAALDDVLRTIKSAEEPLSKRAIEKALRDGDHSRDSVRKGLELAKKRGDVAAEPGGQGGGVVYRVTDGAPKQTELRLVPKTAETPF